MIKEADISLCGKFRYSLTRSWNERKPVIMFVMLNPSKADGLVDDATIRVCIKRANQLGGGSLLVCNLGAYRATSPEVWKRVKDPEGPLNFGVLEQSLIEVQSKGGIVIAAWGNHGSFKQLDVKFLHLAYQAGISLFCLGVTKSGQPKHPLYVSLSQPLLNY